MTPESENLSSNVPQSTVSEVPNIPEIVFPLDRAAQRITKKFYGTYVTPKNSPVNPERFSGYHTGVDFETFSDEQDIDVEIHAVCSGPLLYKKWVSGYGGVLVQECNIENQTVTVLYGHLRFSSVSAEISEQLKADDVLGVLGTGYSTETDNERKHLHLAIHKGGSVSLTGYVQNESSLSEWLVPQMVLGLKKND